MAVALLGAALISPAGAAAEVKQFQDGQGTLHITNPGGAEPGKAGAGPKPVMRPERHSREESPEAPPTLQMQEAPPEAASAPSQVKATPPEAATAPQAEEESPETVITFPLQEAKSPAGSTEEEASAFEPQPRSGRSLGRSGGGGGGGMRGRR